MALTACLQSVASSPEGQMAHPSRAAGGAETDCYGMEDEH